MPLGASMLIEFKSDLLLTSYVQTWLLSTHLYLTTLINLVWRLKIIIRLAIGHLNIAMRTNMEVEGADILAGRYQKMMGMINRGNSCDKFSIQKI